MTFRLISTEKVSLNIIQFRDEVVWPCPPAITNPERGVSVRVGLRLGSGCVWVWLGFVHAWFCACVPYVLALGLVKCWLDAWADSVFGVWLGQSCGLTRCLGFALANFVRAGLGCVHAWFFVCVPYLLALGFVKCGFDVWVDSVFRVWLGQSCGLTTVVAVPLQALFGLGRVVFMLVGLCVVLCSSMM